MNSYKDLYFHLFGVLAQATEYIEQGKTDLAHQALIRAQQEAEEAFLDTEELPDE